MAGATGRTGHGGSIRCHCLETRAKSNVDTELKFPADFNCTPALRNDTIGILELEDGIV